MTLILDKHTLIDYTKSEIESELKYVHHFLDTNKYALFVEKTPFHPVDYRWPDQPADKGFLTINQINFELENCYIAAIEQVTGLIYFHEDIPVKRGTAGWIFLVAHIFNDTQNLFSKTLQGIPITLTVDQPYRAALSTAHSACHLASLALNKVTRNYWKSLPEALDSLNNPNLDALAIVKSKISIYQSNDLYRVGKSMRKKGLNAAVIISALSQIEFEINLQLNTWLESCPEISNYPFPAYITEIRYWRCTLPDGNAIIPCGGTHIARFNNQKINVSINLQEENEILMSTKIIN